MRSTSPDLNQCAQRTTVPLPYSTVHARGVIDWARGARRTGFRAQDSLFATVSGYSA